MGCTPSQPEPQPLHNFDKSQSLTFKKVQQPDYDLDVIQMYNLALAMKHKQPTLNIEIALSCQNLKQADLFGTVNPMIICYKKQNDEENMERLVQIGRTEIIPGEVNPKFIKTFILSYNEEKIQNIEFHVFDIDRNKPLDIDKQNRVGVVDMNMREIVEAGTCLREIDQKSYHKSKGKLKIVSSEYDSGNTKFEIELTANNFMNKHEILLKMEIFKSTEWVPIYKTQFKSNHREIKFQPFEIPTNKIPDEERGRFRIKVFETNDSKTETEIGTTEQIYIQDIYKNQKHYNKVYKDAFIIGHIMIGKFQKVVRDSFLSYIINGAHLHLLLAVDFSCSTSTEHDLKSTQKSSKISNEYIEAINQIVGVLQYFDYYNQIPMYGFGAKLPPYYKTVSQCFALSGNFFEPIIGGGVTELVKSYTKALKKIEHHGPSKLQQIIELSCNYASADPQSSDYYILIIFTDGNIDDKEQVTKLISAASNQALSILFVGLGEEIDEQFLTEIAKMNEKQERNEREKDNKRNIVQFIPFRNFKYDNSHKIIKQIFSKIPKQFIQYMKFRKIKPNAYKKQTSSFINKQSKIAKTDYINNRISENKKYKNQQGNCVYNPNFLAFKKRHLIKQLVDAGFQTSKLLQQMNICMNDINYYIEMESYLKQTTKKAEIPESVLTYIKETNKLDELTEKKRREVQKRTLMKLEAAQNNQFGMKVRKKEVQEQAAEEQYERPANACVQCGRYQIDLMYTACGHVCCCHRCEGKYCQICKEKNVGALLLEAQC